MGFDAFYTVDAIDARRLLYLLLAFVVISSFTRSRRYGKIPTAGRRSIFEPTWLLKFRFIVNSRSIIQDGYQKFKDSSFVVKRLDSDLIVLSNKYLDELRLIPNNKLSNVHSQVKNMLGKYTYSNFLLESDQHVRVLQSYLTPNLKTFLSRSAEELDYSFENDVPQPDEWTEVDIQAILQKMIARVSSRVFIGERASRDETWLNLCLQFPMNVFSTAFIMRLFPPFLWPLVSWILPTRYWLRQNLKLGKQIAAPIIAEYQARAASTSDKPTEKSTLLEWMTCNAQADEATPEKLAPRLMFLSLASIHSTSSAAAAAIFDLCSHPENIAPLREEIDQVLGPNIHFPAKEDLQKLWKLDSFLKESQRCNPPTLLSPQRIALEPLTLSDGTPIPKNATIAFPSSSLFADPALLPHPERFDALRAYTQRMQTPGESSRNLMVSTHKDHLYFGHGRQACPGRFFAANEIKMILVRFLVEYEVRWREGVGERWGSPEGRTWTVDEMCFVDPRVRVEVRRKRG
ncbi:putative cytochrome P450 [Corynespora cassiicola Philippines]|uniref:Putative cytochrome P450 n=1 Tax=Corynespora cassiicola Philippines TaxID=1448308 RepID=A0A2T2NGE2_CORCC|nr:putative cytochrome P450 [Corynespora cassiicola Philippines]